MTAARMSPGVPERLNFITHRAIIYQLIKRQAGSLCKSLLEGVMNGVDAGALGIRVGLTAKRATIEDDGKGMTEREEIEKFFRTFGQPHEASEGKTFGAFRIGRGQLFAYGRNEWRTGPFRMVVDVDDESHAESGFDLYTIPPVSGCSIGIDLYAPLSPRDLNDTLTRLKWEIRFCPCPVTVNGEVVTVDPAKSEWDHVTDEAYIKINRAGTLDVYNHGILVASLGSYVHGVGGTVVSRKPFLVNTARNEIISSCPVWKKVKHILQEESGRLVHKKRTLTDGEALRFLRDVVAGEKDATDNEHQRIRCFRLSTGQTVSSAELDAQLVKTQRRVTFAPDGDPRGDRAWQQFQAVSVSERMLDDLGIVKEGRAIESFVERFTRYRRSVRYIPVDKLDRTKSDVRIQVPCKDWSAAEIAWIEVARRMDYPIRLCVKQVRTGTHDYDPVPARELLIGDSAGTAQGWTDGLSYVAIDRAWLSRVSFEPVGFASLACLLIHEYVHDADDADTFNHSPTFYREVHDVMSYHLPTILNRMPTSLKHLLKTIQRKFERLKGQREAAARDLIRLGEQLLGKQAEEPSDSASAPEPVVRPGMVSIFEL